MIETGERLDRHDEPPPTRSAVLVRLSHSHIRIGSFQRLAYMDDLDGIEVLALCSPSLFSEPEETGDRQFGNLDADAPLADLLPSLLLRISAAIANTVGSWLAAGFVHGVLNTDNFNVTGRVSIMDHGDFCRILIKFDRRLF